MLILSNFCCLTNCLTSHKYVCGNTSFDPKFLTWHIMRCVIAVRPPDEIQSQLWLLMLSQSILHVLDADWMQKYILEA